MRSVFVSLTFVMMGAMALVSATGVLAASPDGFWEGAIEIPNAELAVAVTLTEGPDGWRGTIDIPAQGLRDFALSNVVVDGLAVHFEMAEVPGVPTFDGRLEESGEVVSGTFTQSGQQLPFRLERGDAPATEEDDFLPETPVPGDGLVGEWVGALDVGPVDLRLALHVTAGADGELEAVLDSLDQGAEIPVATVEVDGDTVRLELPSISGRFEGTMSEDGSRIEGMWSQGQTLPLVFHRVAEKVALTRPQTPVAPFPYSSEEVTFRNPASEIDLAGTLVVPEGDGRYAGAVFVSGSGPQDRDETIMGHKPFLVIADYLARNGIASLRFDDRGVGGSGGDHFGSTVEEMTSDVVAAVAYLAARPEIERSAVGVIGHSEGGLSGPIAAVRSDEIDFLVLLAAPGEPLDRLLARQTRAMLELQGTDPGVVDRVAAMQVEDLELLTGPGSVESIRATLRERSAARRLELAGTELEPLVPSEEAAEQNIAQATTPWFLSLMRQDPVVHLRQVEVPVLALFGEKDVQVDAGVNSRGLREALAAAGNPDVEVETLPGLNHLLQRAESGAVTEYSRIEETVSPQALERIAGWISARFPPST